MKPSKLMRLAAVLCAALLAAGALFGCTGQEAGEVNEAQTANRQYMAKVSNAMDDLASRLESFDDAVARGDAVTMRTQADNAFRVLDNLAAIEAPADLTEVRSGYLDGCDDLKNALSAYVDLYTEITSATEDHPFDYATYSERIKSIQDTYDKGIAALQDADKLATQL